MINTNLTLCGIDGKSVPSFKFPDAIEGFRCAKHMENGMYDFKTNRCIIDGCILTANYGSTKKKIYCAKHKEEGMKSKRNCIEDGCTIGANFNEPGQKTLIYCSKHQKSSMTNVISKRCINCKKVAHFNLIGEKSGIWCSDHKATGAVNVQDMITKCVIKDCEYLPLFNFKGKRPIYCDEHSISGMENLDLTKRCNYEGCINIPKIVVDSKYYCPTHCTDETLISILKRQCSICDLAPNTYICKGCDAHKNRKEWEVISMLRKNISKALIHDSNLPIKECSKRRNDAYYDCATHCVIVEVDEDQHKYYSEVCECARISEIVGSLGGLPITIIRFNPDKITNNHNKISVDKSVRFKKLVETVEQELNKIPDKFEVRLIQLYYDDNNEIYECYKSEDITQLVAI